LVAAAILERLTAKNNSLLLIPPTPMNQLFTLRRPGWSSQTPGGSPKRTFQPTQRTQREERKKRIERNSGKKRKLQPIGTELSSFQLNSNF